MNTWIFEEYLSIPIVLYRTYKENKRDIPGISREKIQFGEDEHQYALIIKPSKTVEIRKNTILFIHGGGWAVGSPESFAFVGSFFAKLGFKTILVGYRHAPKYKYPVQLEDVFRGLKAGLQRLEEQGNKVGSIIAAGESSGAQLAGLLVLDEENLRRQGVASGIFSAMILISGPMDFSVCNAKQIKLGLHGFLGSDEDYARADPIRLAGENAGPPVLCIHGNRDPIVDIKNSMNFYNKIKDGCEGKSELIIARGKHHLDLLEIFLKTTEETKDMLEFVYKIEKM